MEVNRINYHGGNYKNLWFYKIEKKWNFILMGIWNPTVASGLEIRNKCAFLEWGGGIFSIEGHFC
jgi:hypothetical protein